MKPLEENDVQSLVDMTLAYYHFQYLAAAVEFDLFTLLAKNPGSSREELAARLELRDTPIRTFLLCLCSVGLLRKDGERYFNSPLAQRYLTKGHPDNFLARVRMGRLLTYQGMGSFYESLKANSNLGLQHVPGKGPTLYARIGENPRLQSVFHDFMASFSRHHTVLSSIDLTGCERLLDVGGGAEATNALLLAKRWPHLHVTLIDLPPVAAAASQRIAESGMQERIEAIGMDCFTQEFPSGFDAVFYAHFLGIFSLEKQRDLVAKGARAVKPRGRLLVVGAVQNEDETNDWLIAQLSAYFLTVVNGEGCLLTWPELQKAYGEAGFEALRQTARAEGDPFAVHTVVEGVRCAELT